MKSTGLIISLILLFISGCTKRAKTDYNESLHNGGKIIKPYYEIKKSRALTIAAGIGLPTAAYFVGSTGGTIPVGGYIAAGLSGTVSIFGVPSALKHNIINKPVTKSSKLDSWLKDYNKQSSKQYVLLSAQNFNGYSYLVPMENKEQFLVDEEIRLERMRQELREKNQRTIMGIISAVGILMYIGSKGGSRNNSDRDNNVEVTCPRCNGSGFRLGYDEMNMRNKCGRCGGTGKVL